VSTFFERTFASTAGNSVSTPEFLAFPERANPSPDEFVSVTMTSGDPVRITDSDQEAAPLAPRMDDARQRPAFGQRQVPI